MFGLKCGQMNTCKHVDACIYERRREESRCRIRDLPRVGNMAVSLNPTPEQLTTIGTPGTPLRRNASFTLRSSIDMIFPPSIWNWRRRKEQ